MKTYEKARSRELRAAGLPIRVIARQLGVSRSSVSRWVADVELSPAQRRALRNRNPAHNGAVVAAANRARAATRRRAAQDEGRRAASAGDALHLTGCMLYWAEGSRSKNAVYFTNSDPEMVKTFVRFLRSCFALGSDRIRVDLNLFADHGCVQERIERHWLDELGLPPSCLRRSTVNAYSRHSQRKRRNKLPYGTCRIAVHDTRVVQHIYGAIQEYGGFERPAWLE